MAREPNPGEYRGEFGGRWCLQGLTLCRRPREQARGKFLSVVLPLLSERKLKPNYKTQW